MMKMKIMVPVKQVARLDVDFEIRDDGRGADQDSIEWETNEWDRFSLEAAVRLRDTLEDGEVVVVSVGDEEAEESLRSCLARGADRGIRIWDESLEDADMMTVARVLAAAAEGEHADLILCGVQSSDSANGATGVAIAGFLGLPRAAVVTRLDYDASSEIVTVDRELEGGLIEVMRIRTPALLTIQTGINEPRYASMRAIKGAREKPLELLALADLGLSVEEVEAAGASRVVEVAHPSVAKGAEMLKGDAREIAVRLLEIIEGRSR